MPEERISACVKRFYGSSAVVQLDDGSEEPAETSSRNKSLVCGDRVLLEERAGCYYIVETEPRRTEFFRTDGFGRRKIVAANIDQIVLVVALQPSPHMQVIDRYWVAARNCSIPMMLLANKVDLPKTDLLAEIEKLYGDLGLPMLCCSAKADIGMSAVTEALAGKVSVFVGPSGVGKSSLVNALVEGAEAQIGKLSDRRDEGRHTTTTADFYDLDNGARIIDSPGIREFGLDHCDQLALEAGFVEIAELASQCRFRDCVHQDTPGCAAESAAQAGDMDPRRLESYRLLLAQIVK